jgi:cysteine desulfurase/selenocysteine lyase
VIYLDHAATSWPKPPEVLRAMTNFLECAGGNPGRSGHRLSIGAARIVFQARETLAEFFHLSDAARIIFTPNVTYALNLVLTGLLRAGDHVVTTSMEHNSVMRPLRALEATGVRLSVVQCQANGCLDLRAVESAITPGTRLVVTTHASNVTGTLMPVAAIAGIAHRAGALLLVDAAQTAGVIPIDQRALGIDFLAFTGHKGLQGPPGTGGLALGDRVKLADVAPLVRGGTGSRSEFEQQPELLPDKYESGTPNGSGIAGLAAGVRWLVSRGIVQLRAQEVELADELLAGLQGIPGVTIYGPRDSGKTTGVISCRVWGESVSDVGLRLDDEFEILSRVGLHCAPLAHKTIGTFPEGTIRLAIGPFTSRADIRATIAAIAQIASDAAKN